MAARALQLLADDELRRKMGAAGREIAIEQFDVKRIVPRYRAMYERVMNGVAV
jgi:glycosyltransferase involved in cell wall biosynthesis